MIRSQLLGVFLLLSFITLAQENNAIRCSDGIDNDGDGLIDCEDSGCLNLPNQGCETCGNGISFADSLISYTPGCPRVDPSPEGALGVADWRGTQDDEPGLVFLGQGGSIRLGFTNNLLTNSDSPDPDIWIFEVGTLVEPMIIELKPLSAFTEQQLNLRGIPDADGDGYYDFGEIGGATSSVDIDAIIPGYQMGILQFDAIEITDVVDGSCGSRTPGADIDAVCALSSRPTLDCNGVPFGPAIIDECGLCLDPEDPAFNQSCADCNGVPNGTAEIDSCGLCLEPTDPNFNGVCLDCFGVPNGTGLIDECGVCLEADDPAFNQSCADCLGVPNGDAMLDACGECLSQTDPLFNQSCADCQGIPNGGAVLDSCGVCLMADDPTFNQSCTDCDGVINGNAAVDQCGLCLDRADPMFDLSCLDCAGVVNGTSIVDSCGDCSLPGSVDFNASCADCTGRPFGIAEVDDCGVCLPPTDPAFGKTCLKEIAIPNAFSPNGDNNNDRFVLGANEFVEATILTYNIYNRWGQLLYSRQNFGFDQTNQWWDGRTNGTAVEPGVYVYLVEVQFLFDGSVQQFKGDIAVVR